MKRTCVLLSTIVLAIGVATCPHLMSVNAAATTFDDTQKQVEKSADSNNLETQAITATEGTSTSTSTGTSSGVDSGSQKVDNWIVDGLTSSSTATDTATVTSTATSTSTVTATDTATVTATSTATVTATSTSTDTGKTVEYTVQPGDYLIKIASEQMGDGSRWQELVELNKDKYPSLLSNPNLIYAGWVLTLPAGSKGNSGSKSGSSSTLSGSDTINANGTAVDASGWGSANPCDPMPSRVSSEYGPRDLFGHNFHNGVDLPIPTGTRVNAMANGTVVAASFEPGGGNYVRIKYDNGYETFYCHLKGATVKAGDRVQAGQQVAISDNTGKYTTGAHLHMEVKVNGTRVNPRKVVKLP
ncbi:MAG: peptidoglycan DD-metalloendopeptidase family protein [Candidatus Riflebacteria bacterium]|nr:peptidoglycan DD-metalloendopeptidase family protein [Candidatus Riflebacteria bacterium]MBR4571738.1 peptidoglycan DD-metalloendopeptidase family protein [Candidatus Riflebacteria bacterium]